MKPESMFDAALRLAAEGVAVFPVGPDKAPLVSGGFHSASTDEETVAAMPWQRAGVMIGCQPAADEVVIDVDPRNGGDKVLALFPALPRTRTTKTRSDGRHYWLTIEPGTEMRGKLGPGIDVKRHAKGYVVIPPSAGYSYIVKGRKAKAPRWLLEELTVTRASFNPGEAATSPRYFPFQTGSPYGEAALRNALGELRDAGQGGRHETLNRIAFGLGMLAAGGELDPDKTCEAILAGAVEVGLEEDDAVDVLRRGWFAGQKQPRSAPR
jgi:hypothetical protein